MSKSLHCRPAIHKGHRTVRLILADAGEASSLCSLPPEQGRDPLAAHGTVLPCIGGGAHADGKVGLVIPFLQGTWMTMDCRMGSAQSPTPPQTDLRGTSFTEKRTDAGNSSSLTAGSTHGFVLFCLGEGTKLLSLKE